MAIQKKLKRQAKSSDYHKIYFWNNKKQEGKIQILILDLTDILKNIIRKFQYTKKTVSSNFEIT
jgi:hypothetical protein